MRSTAKCDIITHIICGGLIPMKTKIIYDYFRTDKLDEKAQKRFCIATMKEGSIISLGDNGAFKVPRPQDIYYFIQLTDDKKQIYVGLFNKK